MNMRGQWFFTGDYVEKDKKEVVRFLDRKDNICRVITEIVVPKYVEQKLAGLQGVERVCVVNLKDQMGKYQLSLVVSRKKGADLNAGDIQKYCEANLPEHERPKTISFLDELPMDSHGMINKYKVRHEFDS